MKNVASSSSGIGKRHTEKKERQSNIRIIDGRQGWEGFALNNNGVHIKKPTIFIQIQVAKILETDLYNKGPCNLLNTIQPPHDIHKMILA